MIELRNVKKEYSKGNAALNGVSSLYTKVFLWM